MYMEATLGISLYNYLMSFLLSLTFSLQQNQRKKGENRFCLEERRGVGWAGGELGGGMAQIMYTYVSKCKK
jgi:hypothetical protein